MPGTLHIFRLKTDPLQYQVNYNLGANSYVQVFDPQGLEDFLRHGAALNASDADALVEELHSAGHTTAAKIDLHEAHLTEMGFTESPSDE